MGNREPHISNAGQVKILQANLDERYREMFCITQELLQNADDAEAKNVLIGKFNGISRFHSLSCAKQSANYLKQKKLKLLSFLA